MPPFLKPRSATPKILAKDEKLSPLNKTNSNYMFIDISLNVPDHVNFIESHIEYQIYIIFYLETNDGSQRAERYAQRRFISGTREATSSVLS